MTRVLIVLSPNLLRRTFDEIGARFPGVELIPPHTHSEFAAMFQAACAPGGRMPDLMIVPFPQALRWLLAPDAEQRFALPPPAPMRMELAQAGFLEPCPFCRVVGLFPLVLAVHEHLVPRPEGWEDLCREDLRGMIVLPPEDTPVPFVYRHYMKAYFGNRAAPAVATVPGGLYPQDINLAVGEGTFPVGVTIPPFARTYREGAGRLVWPREGSIAIPILGILRRGAPPEAAGVLAYLLSEDYQYFFSVDGLTVPVHPRVPFFLELAGAPTPFLWAGWEAQGRIGGEMDAAGAQGTPPPLDLKRSDP